MLASRSSKVAPFFKTNTSRSEANRHDALTPVTSVRPSRQRLHVRAATAVDNIQY